MPGGIHTTTPPGVSISKSRKAVGDFSGGRNISYRASSANKVCSFDSVLGDRMLLASCGGHQKGPCNKESDPGTAVVLRWRRQGKPASQRHGNWYSSGLEMEMPGKASFPEAWELVQQSSSEAGSDSKQAHPQAVWCMGPGCLAHTQAPPPLDCQAGAGMLPCELGSQLLTFLLGGPPWSPDFLPCHSHGY